MAWVLVRVYLTVVGARSAYGALGTVIIALFVLWIMNTLFILGVKIDAEITRAMMTVPSAPYALRAPTTVR